MRYAVPILAVMLLTAGVGSAFEVDGMRSGMSQDQATKVLQASYKDIQIKNDNIMAYHVSTGRFINANFCKGKLVQVQKDLNPLFRDFVRLVDQKTKEVGKPIAAWTKPAEVESRVEINSVSFLWKMGPTFTKVSYTEFPSNTSLDIVYEIRNSCWDVPY